MSAVIATAAKVEPPLAGDFFAKLANYLTKDPAGKQPPLEVAHFLTLQELRRMAPDANTYPYGAKVLAYELLGNSETVVFAYVHHRLNQLP